MAKGNISQARGFANYEPLFESSLSVGNAVTIGLNLYKANFKSYLGISAIATGWILAAVIISSLVAFLLAQTNGQNSILWLLLVACIVVLLPYGIAKYIANSALISRLAFFQLQGIEEPLQTSQRFIRSRLWNFFFAAILLAFLWFGIFMATYFTAAIAIGIIAAVTIGIGFTTSGGEPGILSILLVTILSIAISVLFVLVLLWVGARFFLFEVPLSIEENVGAAKTISRSWSLSAGDVWRIVMITGVALLLGLPLQFVSQLLIATIQLAIMTTVEENSTEYVSLMLLLSYLIGLLISIIFMPFWQSLKSVVYFHLRNRREGLGLRLRDRPSTTSDSL